VVVMAEDRLVEIRDEKDQLVGYRCPVCSRYFGLQEQVQAQGCLASHRELLVEG